jgi:long-chain acyl-CoA synthetase
VESGVCCEYLFEGFLLASFDFIEQIPRNLTGKVLKKDLRAPYWEGHGRDVS